MSGAQVNADKRNANSNLIEVGRITKAHGIRGEVSVDYNADSFELLADSVYLRGRAADGRESLKKYKIGGLRLHKGRPLLFLHGVEDRNAAELLRNFALLVPEDRLPEPDEGEIYLRDLPGLEIFVMESRGGDKKTSLGRLDSVAEMAGQEIWTILTPAGKEILLPANGEFVLKIDPDQGYALIDPPPGLLELYLG